VTGQRTVHLRRHDALAKSATITRTRRTKLVRCALTLIAVVPATAGGPDAAGAPAAPLVPADTVTALSADSPGVTVPADPRLNDYQLAGRILGVATGTHNGTDTAIDGEALWVFGLQWTTTPTGTDSHVGITATVHADGVTLPVPLPASADPAGGGTSPAMWFQASLPATNPAHPEPTTPNNPASGDVTITVTTGGYPQTFDLSTMTRQAPTPTALYRSPTSWELTQTVDTTQDIPTPDPGNELYPALAAAQLPVHLTRLSLSWFPPSGPAGIPTDPTRAWLSVDLSSQTPDPDTYLNYSTPITATDITLTLPGQPPIPATLTPGGGPDHPGVGVFVDRYAFAVPATITTATLSVTPGTLQATGNGFSPSSPTDTVIAQGSATFPLTFPRPPTSTPTGTTHPGALVAPHQSRPRPGHRSRPSSATAASMPTPPPPATPPPSSWSPPSPS
jgi:hypothetical protein